MYFLITGTYTEPYQEDLSLEEVENGSFEWVVEADNQEEAITQLEKGETLVNIREISVEERIEREEQELIENIESEYIYQIFGSLPIREANRQIREMKANKELRYLALRFFNKRQRLAHLIKRQKRYGELSMTEYTETMNKLIDAQTEEEVNKVLNSIKK